MICEEIWRPIAGFEGYYEVSNFGRIKSACRVVRVHCAVQRSYDRRVAERILKPSIGHRGHLSVTLWREHEDAQARIHVLVLEHFSGPRPNGLYACHWDGVPGNNRLDNLYWGTPVENSADKIRHGTHTCGEDMPWSKLSGPDIEKIRSAQGQISQGKLATAFGVRQGHISRIMSGKAWSHVTSSQEGA